MWESVGGGVGKCGGRCQVSVGGGEERFGEMWREVLNECGERCWVSMGGVEKCEGDVVKDVDVWGRCGERCVRVHMG